MAFYYLCQRLIMIVEPRPLRLSPVAKLITVVIIVVLGILLVWAAGAIMTPFIAGAITAYLFNPLIGWLHRRTGAGRALWIAVLYVLIGVLVYSLVLWLGPLVATQYHELRRQIPFMITDIAQMLAANRTISVVGLELDIGPIERPLLDFVAELGRARLEGVPHLVLTAFESILLFITYLIVTFYLLLQSEQITNWLYSLVPAPYRGEIRGLGRQIDATLTGYVRGTLLLIPIMSILTYVVLTLLGVRYALVLAIATGLLETIPLIGPWSAAGIAITVSLLQPEVAFGWSHTVLAIVVGLAYFALRMTEDNFIIPHVMGHAVHLHPVLVIFAILAGGAIAGPAGLLLGIPTIAVARLLLRYLYRKLVDAPEPLSPPTIEAPPPEPIRAPTLVEPPSLAPGPLRKPRS
jgi:predicted PurR-regulated permease PerM